MRLAISGTHNSGKTELLQQFLQLWHVYDTPKITYRQHLIDNQFAHSAETTTQTQQSILDFMVNQLKATTKSDNIVFDRCPLDNLVYTLWAHAHDFPGFDQDFVDKTIVTVKESMRKLDIIFWTRFDRTMLPIDDGFRNTQLDMILEIDNIFSALADQLQHQPDSDAFFPRDDSPVIIELPHGLEDRLELIAQYVDISGDLVDDGSILETAKLEEMERLLKQQQAAMAAEKAERELYAKIRNE